MKTLNTQKILEKLNELGLSQSKLSQELSVSREAVSQWINKESFPRPEKLLKLGQLLSLKYNELVTNTDIIEPVVAFRKVGNSVTKANHIKRAKEMGYALEQLVPFLPFETITKSKTLISPKLDYKYIQLAVKTFRDALGISTIKIEISDIIDYFTKSKTVLIPVLLGSKKNHENALHIHLPQSATNWIYINLDTNELDFKFWLVHELGHILTPQLHDEEAEEFADNFAGAFLFPEEMALKVYNEVSGEKTKSKKTAIIFANAKRYTISPITVLMETNKFAKFHNLPEISFGNSFFAQNSIFSNSFVLVSTNLFGNKKPSVSEYITISAREFQTDFFSFLQKYISQKEVSSSFIRSVLNLSVPDSKEIFTCLQNAL